MPEEAPRPGTSPPPAARPGGPPPVADSPSRVQSRRPQLIEWLQSDDIVAFVSVRDPVERAKSSYNWRKHTCQETAAGSYGKIMCSPLDRVFYECYTTLNAFSEGSCDGSLCGDGWNETSTIIKRLELERGIPSSIRWDGSVHSCEEARSILQDPSSTWPPRVCPECGRVSSGADRPPCARAAHSAPHVMDVAGYFSEMDPQLVREIATNIHGGALPGFPELGRLNPLYVVRNSHISEDINIMMAHHEQQLDFLLTEAAHPADRSDLSAAKRVAEREGVEGRRLPTTHSEYPEKADSYVSPAGEARLRGELRGDYELFDLLVGSQEQRALRPD